MVQEIHIPAKKSTLYRRGNYMEAYNISRVSFNTQRMFQENPPEIFSENKLAVYRVACPTGATHNGEIHFSRWRALPLPYETIISTWKTDFVIREDVFGYEPTIKEGLVELYLNFSNYELFTDYGGPLFAQDEMQVAEHPALGSLRETLLKQGTSCRTVENDRPTPILIRNVERRCSIDTKPCDEHPHGLYGNEFACARPNEIKGAVTPINPPTMSNIIAIEAPTDGYGVYTADAVKYILSTAFTGFSAARHESLSACGAKEVAIHTGFWGCGAYGGNRILMTMLQLIAANMSSIDRLVFHAVNKQGVEDVKKALDVMRNNIRFPSIIQMDNLIDQIVAKGFEWGESDGN